MFSLLNFLQSKESKNDKLSIDELNALKLKAKHALEAFARTPAGKDFIKFLYIMYCDKACIDADHNVTIANIANKELVESLIKYSSINGEQNNE